MFPTLEEYYNSLTIPYEEIASATNNFASENIMVQGSSSSVKLYKGQLLLSGQLKAIVAYKFRHLHRFFKELRISYRLHKKNLDSIVGVYGKNNEYIMVKKYEVNGSLDNHLSSSTLTWLRRLQICVGVARALSCLHCYDVQKDICYMIHGDIKSSKILLDDNWKPKLQGSEFSIVTKRLHLTSEHTTTLQYMDPTYETTGGFSHKSDVFSIGVVLFEVLFGRKAEILNNDNWCFSRMARLRYEERRLDEMIDCNLRKLMDLESLKIFSETAYFCLKEERQQRPDMHQIVKRLERALELQKKHQSPEQSSNAAEGTISNHLKGKGLDHLRIPLSDIKLATEIFFENYCIGSGGYGKVYKAELKDFDGRNSLVTVAIKRIFSREDKARRTRIFSRN